MLSFDSYYLYSALVRSKVFVMIQCKTIFHNYLCTIFFIIFIGLKKFKSSFFPIVKMAANYIMLNLIG